MNFNAVLLSLMISVTRLFPGDGAAELITLNKESLQKIKLEIRKGNSFYEPAYRYLKNYADKLLIEEIRTVVEKKEIPPSGDKHDYMSLSRYAWPDPDKSGGLPYKVRDGEVNPEIYLIEDKKNFESMPGKVLSLALAYFYTEDPAYSAKAVEFLKKWFIDKETFMNPNLNFAQAVKGKNDGQPGGIIDSTAMTFLMDAMRILMMSGEYDSIVESGINSWLARYVTWLTESDNGIKESKTVNNHGTWYDAQVCAIYSFLGKKDEAKRIIYNAMEKRIPGQINPDGKQPDELKRTRGMSYSLYNLQAWFYLSSIAENLGIDMWNYKTFDGRGLKKALDYIVPYLTKERTFGYKQINEVRTSEFTNILARSVSAYNDSRYFDIVKKYMKDDDVKKLREIVLYYGLH